MTPVNCEEAGLHIAAEPASLPAGIAAHVAHCEHCAARLRESLALDRALHRAFALPVPARAPGGPGIGASGRRHRFEGRQFAVSRWALAASALFATVLGLLLWAGRPTDTLAADVVAHMRGEPDSWGATQPLAPAVIERVLAASGMRLDPGSTDVVYAHSCWFRGHWVPHLVVRTDRGPVTVLVLPAEHVAGAEHFTREGYDGTLVPFGGGGLALIGRDSGAVTSQVLERLRASLHALG